TKKMKPFHFFLRPAANRTSPIPRLGGHFWLRATYPLYVPGEMFEVHRSLCIYWWLFLTNQASRWRFFLIGEATQGLDQLLVWSIFPNAFRVFSMTFSDPSNCFWLSQFGQRHALYPGKS